MNCPHCHEKIAPDYSAPWCPFCGKNFSAPQNDPAKTQPPRKFSWFSFWFILSIPAITLWLTPNMFSGGMNGLNMTIMISMYGSVASGVGCGFLLARWKGGTITNQISMGIVFSVLCAIVSFTICCASCAVPALIAGMIR